VTDPVRNPPVAITGKAEDVEGYTQRLVQLTQEGWTIEQTGTFDFERDLYTVWAYPPPVRIAQQTKRRRVWPWVTGMIGLGLAGLFGLGIAVYTFAQGSGVASLTGPAILLVIGTIITFVIRRPRKCSGLHCSGCQNH